MQEHTLAPPQPATMPDATARATAVAGPRHDELAQLASAIDNSPRMAAQRAQLPPNRTGLPTQLKQGIEALSRMSMDHVRVHYNSSKPAQLEAHAYAQGSEIHLASGQERHLPHEAWHVVQQAQGRVRPTMQMKGGVSVNDDAGLEAEADRMGGRASSYALPALQRRIKIDMSSTVGLSRYVAQRITNSLLEYILKNKDTPQLAAKAILTADMKKNTYGKISKIDDSKLTAIYEQVKKHTTNQDVRIQNNSNKIIDLQLLGSSFNPVNGRAKIDRLVAVKGRKDLSGKDSAASNDSGLATMLGAKIEGDFDEIKGFRKNEGTQALTRENGANQGSSKVSRKSLEVGEEVSGLSSQASENSDLQVDEKRIARPASMGTTEKDLPEDFQEIFPVDRSKFIKEGGILKIKDRESAVASWGRSQGIKLENIKENEEQEGKNNLGIFLATKNNAPVIIKVVRKELNNEFKSIAKADSISGSRNVSALPAFAKIRAHGEFRKIAFGEFETAKGNSLLDLHKNMTAENNDSSASVASSTSAASAASAAYSAVGRALGEFHFGLIPDVHSGKIEKIKGARVHGDANPSNIFVSGENVTLIDNAKIETNKEISSISYELGALWGQFFHSANTLTKSYSAAKTSKKDYFLHKSQQEIKVFDELTAAYLAAVPSQSLKVYVQKEFAQQRESLTKIFSKMHN